MIGLNHSLSSSFLCGSAHLETRRMHGPCAFLDIATRHEKTQIHTSALSCALLRLAADAHSLNQHTPYRYD